MTQKPPNEVWAVLKAQVTRRDGHKCRRCGTKEGVLEVHHKIPAKWGGSNELSNLELLCEPCRKKRDKLLRYHAKKKTDFFAENCECFAKGQF